MKKIILGLSLVVCHLSFSYAQPGWVKKASKSVFTLKTFGDDGSLIASSNGFFVGQQGEALSSFTPFIGAARAIIIDASGKEMPVTGMMGANEMYDVAKFRVAGKTQPLAVAASTASVGTTAWLLPYRETKTLPSGIVRKAEKFQADYAYYTIAMQTPEQAVSCPLLNDAGEVIGLIQPSAAANDSLSYAVSARFADSLKITGLSLSSPTLRMTKIKTELPDDLHEANLMVFMAGSTADSLTYINLLSDFIQKFPSAPDGYTYRAQFAAAHNDFAIAERDMEQAIKLSDQKDEAHFNYARLIYNKEIFQSQQSYANWTLDKALTEIREAIQTNPLPTYRQVEGNVLFAQGKYDEAYPVFIELTKSNLDEAEMWFAAARCKEMLKDTTAMLALMDSTVSTFSKPYLKQAAPYLWARANARLDAGKFRDAISDMNDYEQLMSTDVNARFYYIRHQAEIEGRLYQQALNDISRAIQMEPKETLYYAEKASLEVRVGMYDEAIETAKECIAIDPNLSDGYLFLGLAQCVKGNTKEGVPNLQKAKDLGDPQAETLIQKYK
ncbi:MAG: tetratricopeptide repeat protein [Prevotella sp.]|nr:tetratricopeptide repeat protein [Prevotella sp.]